MSSSDLINSHLTYSIISLVYSWRIFIIIFYFSKKEEEKSGVYGDVNRDSKWNHKKRWPHLIEQVPLCLFVLLLQKKEKPLSSIT